MQPRTLVFVHAHPDDEALLTAGTMARAVAEGHRVVLIMATDGAAGLTDGRHGADLRGHRDRELERSVDVLGVSRLIRLGYADSGLNGDVPEAFVSIGCFTVGREIARVVDEEGADVLIGYDSSGGYGHPDHVHVHRSTRTAVQLARKQPTLFEVTLPREPLLRAVHTAARARLTPPGFDPHEFDGSWTPRRDITHRVDVRDFLDEKREAMRAHASQAVADTGPRTLALLGRLPRPVARLLLGTEYYVRVPHAATSSTNDGSLNSTQ